MVYKCEAIIERVKQKLAAADPDPSKRTVLFVFQFNITSDGKIVKSYTIDLKNLEVYEGAAKTTVDVTVSGEDDTLEDILKKKISVEEALKNGSIKASGDNEAIAKIKALIQKVISQ